MNRKTLLGSCATAAILLAVSGCTYSKYHAPFDYYQDEVRHGKRGIVTDNRGYAVTDRRDNCVTTDKLYVPELQERLAYYKKLPVCVIKEDTQEPAEVVYAEPKKVPVAQTAPTPAPTVEEKVETSMVEENAAKEDAALQVAVRPFYDSKIVFFEFDKEELTEASKIRVRALLDTISKSTTLVTVKIAGHADRMGGDSYNQNLSERRSKRVQEFLKAEGNVDAEIITTEAFGETVSVTNCSDDLSRAELIECLQPDRRAEIIIEGFSEE